jgi:DNA polymerase-3 subunit gamma/tau
MDAASQRGIDDIRDIRERVVLQPVEGQYKVYILDEAHQLTDAAWNALLKLIEEPPPHLMFVFCTTELQKVLPTVRSRCQTFVFQRPRLPDLVRKLRLISDAEEIDVPDAALALIARGGRGAYRDAESTLDQLAAATGGTITVQDVLQLLGAVEDEVLFRLVDMVAAGETAEALLFLEEISSQGQDLGRLVLDLLEHLRHLLLVQHMHEVPESVPVTDEAKERLREQANQLPPATVVRLIDLLAVAVDDMRQGGDPRLPLELALVKVTRPSSDLSRESLAFRLDRLEEGERFPRETLVATGATEEPAPMRETESDPLRVELGQLQEAWRRTILPAVESRSIPIGKTLAEAHPSALAGDTLTLEFPQTASFHLKLAEDPKNAAMLRDALYEVTGRKLAVDFALGERGHEHAEDDDAPASEEDVVELMKSTFDARELDNE